MIIVTGGSGRVGRAAVKDLMEKGYTIASVDMVPQIHLQFVCWGGLLSSSCRQTRPVFGFSQLGLPQRRRTAQLHLQPEPTVDPRVSR